MRDLIVLLLITLVVVTTAIAFLDPSSQDVDDDITSETRP